VQNISRLIGVISRSWDAGERTTPHNTRVYAIPRRGISPFRSSSRIATVGNCIDLTRASSGEILRAFPRHARRAGKNHGKKSRYPRGGKQRHRVPTAGAPIVNPNPPILTIARSNFHILLESNNAKRPADRSRAARNLRGYYLTPDLPYISARARARERASVPAARLDPRWIDRGNNDRMERTMDAHTGGNRVVT